MIMYNPERHQRAPPADVPAHDPAFAEADQPGEAAGERLPRIEVRLGRQQEALRVLVELARRRVVRVLLVKRFDVDGPTPYMC